MYNIQIQLESNKDKLELIKKLDQLKYEEKFSELYKLSRQFSVEATLAKERLLEAFAIAISKLSDADLILVSSSDAELTTWFNKISGEDILLSSEETNNLRFISQIQIKLRKSPIVIPALVQGPLDRNKATERLLYIYSEAVKNNVIFANNIRNEVIVYTDKQSFNLTYLLGEADFSQFRLPEEAPDSANAESNISDAQPALTEDELSALRSYTDTDYITINKLLRTGKYPEMTTDVSSAYFKKACLITNALNKHSRERELNLYWRYQDAKEHFLKSINKDSCQDREYINEILEYAKQNNIMSLADCNEFVERHFLGSIRKSDYVPEKLAYNEGFMSSALAKTAKDFSKKQKTVLSFHGTSVRTVSKYDKEAEMLVTSGQQHYFADNDLFVYAVSVNTPSLQKPNDYPWLRAIQVSYDEHLSKPYTETDLCSSDLRYQDIVRPNHGLAHTMRKVHYFDQALEFLIKHCKKSNERKILKKLKPDEIQKLKTTLAFYVSGRKSEVSWKQDDNAVKRYRDDAVANFKKHVATDPAWKPEEIEKYAQLLIYYREEEGGDTRDFKFRTLDTIFDFCHQLDLARCYKPAEMKEAVDVRCFQNTTTQTDEAKKDLITLKKWAVDCIKATGDRLLTDVNEAGEYIAATSMTSYDYQKFGPASKDPLACLKILRSFPSPNLAIVEKHHQETPATTQVTHFQYQQQPSPTTSPVTIPIIEKDYPKIIEKIYPKNEACFVKVKEINIKEFDSESSSLYKKSIILDHYPELLYKKDYFSTSLHNMLKHPKALPDIFNTFENKTEMAPKILQYVISNPSSLTELDIRKIFDLIKEHLSENDIVKQLKSLEVNDEESSSPTSIWSFSKENMIKLKLLISSLLKELKHGQDEAGTHKIILEQLLKDVPGTITALKAKDGKEIEKFIEILLNCLILTYESLSLDISDVNKIHTVLREFYSYLSVEIMVKIILKETVTVSNIQDLCSIIIRHQKPDEISATMTKLKNKLKEIKDLNEHPAASFFIKNPSAPQTKLEMMIENLISQLPYEQYAQHNFKLSI